MKLQQPTPGDKYYFGFPPWLSVNLWSNLCGELCVLGVWRHDGWERWHTLVLEGLREVKGIPSPQASRVRRRPSYKHIVLCTVRHLCFQLLDPVSNCPRNDGYVP